VIRDDAFTKAVKEVKNGLTLTSRDDTYIFEIKYTDTTPTLAADVANTTAKSFMNYMEEIRSSEAQYVRDQLQSQLEQSRQQFVSAREGLQSYKEAHSVFLYETEYSAKLKEISDLELELAKLEQALVGGQGTLSTLSAAAKRSRIIRLINERKAELTKLPMIERELKVREADVEVARTAYETLAKSFKEADIKHSYPTPEVRLVSNAIPPYLPSSPLRGTITLASLLAGLVIGMGLAFFLEYLSRKGIYRLTGSLEPIADREQALGGAAAEVRGRKIS
jgi:uncharacterized protein involved in exopolysaccharide biosynthesis